MQPSREVSIIFLKMVDDRTVWNFERKKKMCWSIFVFVFHKFQRDSRFLHKIPGYFQGSRSKKKIQAFQGFQGAVGTLSTCIWSVLKIPSICNVVSLLIHYKLEQIILHITWLNRQRQDLICTCMYCHSTPNHSDLIDKVTVLKCLNMFSYL